MNERAWVRSVVRIGNWILLPLQSWGVGQSRVAHLALVTFFLGDVHSLTHPLCWSGSRLRKAPSVSTSFLPEPVSSLCCSGGALWEKQMEPDK